MIAWIIAIIASLLVGAAMGVTLMCVVIVGSDRQRTYCPRRGRKRKDVSE